MRILIAVLSALCLLVMPIEASQGGSVSKGKSAQAGSPKCVRGPLGSGRC